MTHLYIQLIQVLITFPPTFLCPDIFIWEDLAWFHRQISEARMRA